MNVEWVELGEVLTARSGERVDPSNRYPIAGVFGFGRGVLLRKPIAGTETGYKTLTKLSTGDVVYSKLKAFEGAIACVHSAADGHYVSPEFPVFRVDPRVSWRYLEHVLQSPMFLELLAAASTGLGARRERVHPAKFLALRVPLPSRMEQERIVRHLAALIRAGCPGPKHAQSVLSLAIERAGESSPVKRVGAVLAGHRPWVDLQDSTLYRPIGVRGFGRGMIRYAEETSQGLSKLRYYPIEPGALIVSNIKAWEGAVCVAEDSDRGRIASNRFLQYLPRSTEVAAGWVEQYLLSPAGLRSLSAASPGSADRNRTLSMAAFEAIEIPVPNRETQEAVLRVAHALRRVRAHQARRDELSAAILPAARNEIFNSPR